MEIPMRQYFKGYYFKCSTDNETIALIPALYCDGKRSSASLQIITNEKSYSVAYPEIAFGKGRLQIKIGHNYFSEKGIYLDIDDEECRMHGKLKFGELQKIKYDIMGPFHYVPFMQCRHSVISMHHSVTGKITVNGKEYYFANGIGYIEGDRGYSFPKEYIWTQCHFGQDSVMLSVADIPLCGLRFQGIIGIVMIDGKEYRITTYLGARVRRLSNNMVVVRQGKYTLSAKLLEANSQNLQAPVMGKMIRTIRESVACKAWYQFVVGDTVLLEGIRENASFEYMYRGSI